jgi:Na+/melibiose symporter-like transporter
MADIVPEFRRLLAAEVVSNFGSMLSRLAIPLIATLVLDVTPLQMGALAIAGVAAGAVGSLFLGVWVDRLDKRAMMLAADFGRMAIAATLAWTAAAQRLSFWMLVFAATASGLLTILFELARSAWVAQRSQIAELPTRNAQLSMGMSLSETAAFALGGWLYQGWGAVTALVIDAVSYLVSALFVRGVRATSAADEASERPRDPARTLLREARAGIAAVLSQPTLSTLAIVEILIALGGSLGATSYMIFVARDLGFDAGALGLIVATGGAGSLLGAAIAPRLGARFGPSGAMRSGLALCAFGALCVPLAPGATILGAALLIAQQVIGDGGQMLYAIHDRTLRQMSVGPELLGRVDAGIRTLGQLATLLGVIGGGVLATEIGTRPALVLQAALLASAGLVLLVRPPVPRTSFGATG